MPVKVPEGGVLAGARRLTRRAGRWVADAPAALRATPHNERVLYTEVILQATVDSGAMSFLSVLLVRLGAPDLQVGLFTSLPALVTIFLALPAGAFVQARRDLLRTLGGARLLYRLGMALFAFIPLLPGAVASPLLVGLRTLMAVPLAASGVAHTTILGQAIEPRRRSQVLSLRMAVHGLAGALMGYLAGQWLDRVAYPLNYQVLFLSGFVAGLGGIALFSRLRLPAGRGEPEQRPPRVRLGEMLRLIASTPSYRGFAIAEFIFRVSMNLPTAVYAIFRVRTLGASDAWIGILLTVERLLSVFSYLVLSRLLRRPGFRKRLWLSCLGMALYPFTMALARSPEGLLLPTFCVGLLNAGMNIYITDTLIAVSPEERRATFVAANTLLTNVAAFFAPLLGTAIAGVVGIPATLFGVAAFRLLGGLSFYVLSERAAARPAGRAEPAAAEGD